MLLLSVLVLLVPGCATTTNGHTHGPVEPRPPERARCVEQRHKIVDLTHAIQEAMPIFPGGVPFKKEVVVDYDAGYRAHKFELGENTGTHVDAPAHFFQGKPTISEIAVDELVVPLAVINVSKKVKSDPDYQVSGSDIVDWEGVNGPVPVGSLFVANTGWHKRFQDPAKYLNADAEGVLHFPGFSAEAAKLLMERDVVGLGIDTLSLDHGISKDFATHKVVLAAGKYQVENLANLDDLPDVGATVVVAVLPVVDGTQAQARVLALVPEPDESADSGESAEPIHGSE
jgi:kynurenine formamidase